jgi:hypothetical protein
MPHYNREHNKCVIKNVGQKMLNSKGACRYLKGSMLQVFQMACAWWMCHKNNWMWHLR